MHSGHASSIIPGPAYFEAAQRDVGTTEIKGPEHNAKILEYWRHGKISWMTTAGDEEPWCAVFACAKLENAGVRSPRSAWALDFAKWGVRCNPEIGCIVVLPRHVGFYGGPVGTSGKIWVLGGNQSDSVRWSQYDASAVIDYRTPEVETDRPAVYEKIAPSMEDVRDELRERGSRTVVAADRIEVTTKWGLGGLFGLGTLAKVVDWLGELMPHADTVSKFFSFLKDHQFLVLGLIIAIILSNNKAVIFARIDDFLKGIRKK